MIDGLWYLIFFSGVLILSFLCLRCCYDIVICSYFLLIQFLSIVLDSWFNKHHVLLFAIMLLQTHASFVSFIIHSQTSQNVQHCYLFTAFTRFVTLKFGHIVFIRFVTLKFSQFHDNFTNCPVSSPWCRLQQRDQCTKYLKSLFYSFIYSLYT